MVLSKKFKMKTTFLCFIIIAFTLSGSELFNSRPVESALSKKKIETAEQELKRLEQENKAKLQQLESKMIYYELRKKSVESK